MRGHGVTNATLGEFLSPRNHVFRPQRGSGTTSVGGSVPVSLLDDIMAGVRADVAARQRLVPLDQLKARAAGRPRPLDGVAALKRDAVTVIAR